MDDCGKLRGEEGYVYIAEVKNVGEFSIFYSPVLKQF